MSYLVLAGAGWAQQADREALRLLNQSDQLWKAGQLDEAMRLARQVVSLKCCARYRAMSYEYQADILEKRGNQQEALDCYRQSQALFDQAYADATAANDDEKQCKVLRWQVGNIVRMLQIGLPGDEARRCYASARQYVRLSQPMTKPVDAKRELEDAARAIEQLWSAMPSHYADVLTSARRLYDAQSYQEAITVLEPWASPPQAPDQATDLDVAEGCCLRALCLCQIAIKEPDDTRTEGMVKQAQDLLLYTTACPASQKQEAQQVLALTTERLGERVWKAALDRAWQAHDQGAVDECREALAAWVASSQRPRGMSEAQAGEGLNLMAWCLCREAAEATNQASFEDRLRQARALMDRGLQGSDRSRQLAATALADASENRYATALRDGRTQYDAKAYAECLATLQPWMNPGALPLGATERQNAEAFSLRGLSLCHLSLTSGDDVVSKQMIDDAKRYFGSTHRLPREQREEGVSALAVALADLGKKQFARQQYASAYLNLKESCDLLDSRDLRFMLGECHRLDPDSAKAYLGPAFLRDCIFTYQHLLQQAPDSEEGRGSAQRLPGVIQRCNQTALMQLDPEQWGTPVNEIERRLRTSLVDAYGTWWLPEGAVEGGGRTGFLFDSVIEATTGADAARLARERGDVWLVQVSTPKTEADAAGVIVRVAFTTEVQRVDGTETHLAASIQMTYKADRTTRRDLAGAYAADLLRQLRERFLTDLAHHVPTMLGAAAPAEEP
ncbi:hypothetical protein LLH23_01610 [bacterium]|nr:hypothetical protein [bacterium]